MDCSSQGYQITFVYKVESQGGRGKHCWGY